MWTLSENQNAAGGKKPIKIEGKQGNFQESTTVHDRYEARPRSVNPDVEGKLEKMCLAQFATSYTPIAKLPKKAEMDEDGCSKELSSQKVFSSENYLPKYIQLEDQDWAESKTSLSLKIGFDGILRSNNVTAW